MTRSEAGDDDCFERSSKYSSCQVFSFRLLLGSLIFVGGWVLLSLHAVVSSYPVSFLFSSLIIILILVLCVKSYGPMSVPMIVFVVAFAPALSYLWAWVNGAQYINYHNHWLQEDISIVNKAVLLVAVSALIAYAILAVAGKSKLKELRIKNQGQILSNSLYLPVIVASGFFFWLTEPSLETIFTAQYSKLLNNRFENTQYAGGMAVMLWVLAFATFSVRTSRFRAGAICAHEENTLSWSDRLFVIVTFIAVLWLALHARRSELIGIGAVLLLFYADTRGQKKAVTIAIFFLVFLSFVGVVRNYTVFEYFSQEAFANDRGDIVSLPGGHPIFLGLPQFVWVA